MVGSPHHGRLGRVFLGSVATSLLHGAACPVAVAPRGFAGSDHSLGIRLIAIAYDGTAGSMIALRHAEALALRTWASVRLLTVVSPARAPAIPGSAGLVPAVPPQSEKVLAAGIAAVGGAVRADGRGSRRRLGRGRGSDRGRFARLWTGPEGGPGLGLNRALADLALPRSCHPAWRLGRLGG